MTALFGNIGPFDEATEQWSAYTERFEYFALPNRIHDDVKVPTFKWPCYRCRVIGYEAQECWCRDLDCRHCGKKGHIERVCRNKY